MIGTRTIAAIMAAVLFSGCSSVKSTFLSRNESNTAWQEIKTKGVPITLRVPTHLRVAVVERHYLVERKIGDVKEVTRLALDTPVRAVNWDLLYTNKIFTVDFARPAAGTMNLKLELDAQQQYFEKIEHQVIDETIDDIANLITKVAPQGFFAPSSAGGAPGEPWVKDIESVVAVGVFEVDAPDFELQVAEFIECHLNKAHDAYVVPPGAEIYRVPLTGDPRTQPPLCFPGSTLCPIPSEPYFQQSSTSADVLTPIPSPASPSGSY